MRLSRLTRACIFSLALMCPSFSTPLMQKAAGADKCVCKEKCDCGPVCDCAPVQFVLADSPADPPQWVLDGLRKQAAEQAAKHEALAGKHATLATEVQQLKAETAASLARIEKLLTDRQQPAGAVSAAPATPKDRTEELLASIAEKLDKLAEQKVAPPQPTPAANAEPSYLYTNGYYYHYPSGAWDATKNGKYTTTLPFARQAAVGGSAAPTPFAQAGITPATTAPAVVPASTFSPGQPAGVVTITHALGAGSYGSTSGGCAGGDCGAVQTRRGFFR